MAESRVLNVKVSLTGADKAQAALKNVEKGGTKIGNAFQWVQKNWAAVTAAIAGAQGIINFLNRAYAASLEHAQATEKLTAGLKNVAGYSDEARDALLRQADAMERLVRVDGDLIVDAQAMLTSFQLNADAVQVLTPRLLDMSAATTRAGKEASDLVSIATALGKAIIGSSGALTRYGVTLTDVQKQQLKTATGMDRINLIAEILDTNYKGMAETVGQGAAGSMRDFKLALDQVYTATGDFMTQSVAAQDLTSSFANLLRDLADWMNSSETISSIDEYYSRFVDWLVKMDLWSERTVEKHKKNQEQFVEFMHNIGKSVIETGNDISMSVAKAWKDVNDSISNAVKNAYETVKQYMNAIRNEMRIGAIKFLGSGVLSYEGVESTTTEDIYSRQRAKNPRPASLGRAVYSGTRPAGKQGRYNRQYAMDAFAGLVGAYDSSSGIMGAIGSYGGEYLGGAVGRTLGSKAAASMFGASIGSLAGPIGTIIGSIFGELVGGLFKKKPRQASTEAILVKDVAIRDLLSQLLNVAKVNLNTRGAGGIDRLNNLRLQQGVAI